MGNNHVKKSKSTNPEYATPKPPEGMPNPMDFDLQDIETPDDVFIQRQTRYKTKYEFSLINSKFYKLIILLV